MSSHLKTPPTLNKGDNFENWEKAVKVWQLLTDLPAEKQGPAVLLALTGKDRDVALELPITEINAVDGCTRVLTKLGKVYKKDTVDTEFESFENFIRFKRKPNTGMNQYINEFESLYAKAKEHKV